MIYIHTRNHNGWLMGKQAGQSSRREGGVWALLLNTEQRIRDKRCQSARTQKYRSLFQTASRHGESGGERMMALAWISHIYYTNKYMGNRHLKAGV